MSEVLQEVCSEKGLRVEELLLIGDNVGYLVDNVIYINKNATKKAELLAHEIAHAYLHYDKGNTVESPLHDLYEEQANRAAQLILDVIKALN